MQLCNVLIAEVTVSLQRTFAPALTVGLSQFKQHAKTIIGLWCLVLWKFILDLFAIFCCASMSKYIYGQHVGKIIMYIHVFCSVVFVPQAEKPLRVKTLKSDNSESVC